MEFFGLHENKICRRHGHQIPNPEHQTGGRVAILFKNNMLRDACSCWNHSC